VGFLTDIKAVSRSPRGSFVIALKNDNTLWAWGRNEWGQLGIYILGGYQTSPNQVHGENNVGYLTNVKSVSTGEYHSLALKNDNTVWAWGYGVNGQLGNNWSGPNAYKLYPNQVHGENNVGYLTGVTSIAAGEEHSLAVRNEASGNNLYAWGANNSGQLGDNSTVEKYTPTKVHGPNDVGFLDDIKNIGAGGSHSLALRNDNALWAWGNNGNGQLGDNNASGNFSMLPIQVHGKDNIGFLTDVSAIVAGAFYSLVYKIDGTAWTWGNNASGQLGDNTIIQRNTPVQVKLPPQVSISPETGTISSGGEITYNLTVKNLSPDVLSNQPLTIGLPSGTSYVLSSGRYNGLPVTDAPDADNYNFSNNQASWTVLTLAPSGQSGSTVTASFKARAN